MKGTLAFATIILIGIILYTSSSPTPSQSESESTLFGRITEEPLRVTLEVVEHELHAGDSVQIRGTVSRLGEPAIGATVTYDLVSPTGELILEGKLKTASSGEFSTFLKIPNDAASGVYDLDVTATYQLHSGSEKTSLRILSPILESAKPTPLVRETRDLFSLSIFGLLAFVVIVFVVGRLVKAYNKLMDERRHSQ